MTSPAKSLAIAAVAMSVLHERTLFQMLMAWAMHKGIDTNSEVFDEAAELLGMPYCRALDLYVDRATKARAEAMHFSEAHHALLR